MASRSSHERQGGRAAVALFRTTHWSVILAAGHARSAAGREALEELCRTYWYPLYAFVRQLGYTPPDAQDLTQDFFLRLIDRQQLAQVQPQKGRFRSFLLVALKHFLADARERARTQKRGGGQVIVSLDHAEAEGRYHLESSHELAPDRLFERRWAYTLLESAIGRLRNEFYTAGKQDRFDQLKPFLIGEGEHCSYAQAAKNLGLSEAAAKMAATRMRQRYRQLLRAEVANTVATPGEIDDELNYLFAIVQT